MPFTITCPNCDAKLKATEALVGKTIKCPRCSRAVHVQQPAPASTTPHLEIPPAREDPLERPELEEPASDGPTRAARLAGETDVLPEVEDAEEVEEAEIDEVMPADDDYDRPRRMPRRPAGVAPEERQTALFVYLLGIFTGFVGPLILWMMKRDESKFINHHGKEVINFTITLIIPSLVLTVVGCPFIIFTWGLALFIVGPLFMAVNIYGLVMLIMGATRASRGEWWEFPISIRMIK